MGNTSCICYEPETTKCPNEYEQCNGQYHVSIKQVQAYCSRHCYSGGKKKLKNKKSPLTINRLLFSNLKFLTFPVLNCEAPCEYW